MRFIPAILFPMLILIISSCGARQKSVTKSNASDTIRYAKGFSIEHSDCYTSVRINDPWDSTRILQHYLLIDKDKELPNDLPEGVVIRTPLSDVVAYSSVHVAILDMLGVTDRIIGVCEPQYIKTTSIRKGIETGQIADLGEAGSPNIEKMMDIGAQAIIASPFKNSGYGMAGKLGIPIIEGADYMEPSPLGRMEWIRFYGILFGKEALADSLFQATEKRYNDLKELAATVKWRPSLLPEKKYGSTWFISGNDSYMANLYKDAGADYAFSYISGTEAVPLSFETVLDKAIHADLWLIKYNQANDLTLDMLKSEYTPYCNFDAFKKQAVYGCNTGAVPYYEETPMHPDYLLKDLIRICHPQLLPDYRMRYFHLLK